MNRIAEHLNVTRLHLVNHVPTVNSRPDPQSSTLNSMPAATLWLRLVYTNLQFRAGSHWLVKFQLKVND